MIKPSGIVVGGGAVGVDFHVPRLLSHVGVKNLFIVEPDEQRSAFLKQKFKKKNNIIVVKDIPQRNYDIAVIATPPIAHLSLFTKLLDHSDKIVIEKPITKSVAEARQIIELCDSAIDRVYIAHIRRSLKNFQWLKSYYQNQVFGELQSVNLSEGNVFSWNAVSLGSFSRELNGGGVLMDTGPHALDQLFQVFKELELCESFMDAVPRLTQKAIEANAVLQLTGDGSVPITLSLSRNRIFPNLATFKFENTTVSLSLHNNSVQLQGKSCPVIIGEPLGVKEPVTYSSLFDAFYDNFVIPGENDAVSPIEAIKSQVIIEKAYIQAQQIEGGF